MPNPILNCYTQTLARLASEDPRGTNRLLKGLPWQVEVLGADLKPKLVQAGPRCQVELLTSRQVHGSEAGPVQIRVHQGARDPTRWLSLVWIWDSAGNLASIMDGSGSVLPFKVLLVAK